MSLSNHNPLNKEVALEVCSFVGTMRKVDTNETIHIGPGCYVTSFEGDFTLNNVDFQWIEHSLDVPTELKGNKCPIFGNTLHLGGEKHIWDRLQRVNSNGISSFWFGNPSG